MNSNGTNSSIFLNASNTAFNSAGTQSFVILIASWGTIPFFCAGALLNAVILVTFFIHASQLVNPFSVHIVNLTILNLAYCLILSPLILYRNFDESWLHSSTNCGFYKYASWTISNLLVWQHFVVCLDRWLAFTVPLWYRERKTVKMGNLVFLGVILFYHVWYLPLFVKDLLVERDTKAACFRTTRTPYAVIFTFIITVLPQLCIYVSNPLLLFLIWRRRTRRNQVQIETTTDRGEDSADISDREIRIHNRARLPDPALDRSMGKRNPTLFVNNASGNGRRRCSADDRNDQQNPSSDAQGPRDRRRPALSRNAQLVFFITLAQIMTALPETVFSLLLSQKASQVSSRYAENGLLLSYLLGAVLFVLDPVIYIIFLPNLRSKCAQLFRPKICGS